MHTKLDPRVKATVCTENIHIGLSVVALVSLVDIGLCKHNQVGTRLVPLQLHLVALEECLLRNRGRKRWDVEDLDGSGLALQSISMILNRRYR